MSDTRILDSRQINLSILICIAILFPIIGHDIRHYIDSKQYIYLAITMSLVVVLFYIIKQCIDVVIIRRDKSIYTK